MTENVEPSEVRSFWALVFGTARKQLLRVYEGRGQLEGEEMTSRISLAELCTTPTQKIARQQDRALVQQALSELPLDDQIAVELRYWQRLSVRDVAAILGWTEAGTKTRLHRARLKLKQEYSARSDGRELDEFEDANR
jgi:RNA polymerase sigma factor (sigma-70 family)